MNRYVYLAILLALVILSYLAGSSRNGATISKETSDKRQVLYYVDPMNPANTSNKPGLAPCGMKMEPVYANTDKKVEAVDDTIQLPAGSVQISAEKQQLIGIRMAAVEKTAWGGSFRLPGKVVPDETRIYRINAATDGWVKRILPVTTGSIVRKDELLATFYAPEFFSAMKAFLFGRRSMERFQKSSVETKEQLETTDANIENYRNGLRNLGMTDHQLDEIMRTGQGGDQVEIRAPEAGFVLSRNITLGERFQRGTELYRIADLSHVWVLADIFENESWLHQPGLSVRVTYPAQKARIFRARVSDILPQFDAGSRTLKVRIEVDNPDFVLRPDVFVDVEIPVVRPPALTIPSDAVLDSGTRKTVFVERGNAFFEPRLVETGASFGDRVEVTRGLQLGERVVAAGNFFIDSESKMRLAAAGTRTALGDETVSVRGGAASPMRSIKAVSSATKTIYDNHTMNR
ncbi:MAG TPA: efflux RND transporter periplasmic adaptor subunit [Syntrophorhabdaceae bacterium]|nr:efflux RND transporter periplasmic adaptor subunit [Syntrophorhabdaceae bacterium]